MQKYEKQQPLPTFRPMSMVAKWSPISATAELLLWILVYIPLPGGPGGPTWLAASLGSCTNQNKYQGITDNHVSWAKLTRATVIILSSNIFLIESQPDSTPNRTEPEPLRLGLYMYRYTVRRTDSPPPRGKSSIRFQFTCGVRCHDSAQPGLWNYTVCRNKKASIRWQDSARANFRRDLEAT